MDRRSYGAANSQQRVLYCTDGGHPGQFVVRQIPKREDSQKRLSCRHHYFTFDLMPSHVILDRNFEKAGKV
jgi:hypothetical protein